MLDEFIKANLGLWNEWTEVHEKSEFYDVEGFKAGKLSLRPLEVAELGDVSGRSLLHLQCHFGLDTLDLVRVHPTLEAGFNVQAMAILDAGMRSSISGKLEMVGGATWPGD